jgi:hypothetical protein
VIVRFVDIDGMDVHHLLFIIHNQSKKCSVVVPNDVLSTVVPEIRIAYLSYCERTYIRGSQCSWIEEALLVRGFFNWCVHTCHKIVII